jgi:LmbE family N-acetylglucosaminyl deacetylase
MISMRPGDEDVAALATYRLWKGATVLSLYVTNGEALESREGLEYPPMLAARRRAEAQKAMGVIGCDAYFLNMPDMASARDTSDVNRSWISDTLEIRLMQIMSTFRPDMILLNTQGKPGIVRDVWRLM